MNQQGKKRISGASLSEFLGQSVAILGECMQLDSNGRTLTLKTTNNNIVTVQLQEPAEKLLEGIVEVQGVVSSNNTLQCHKVVTFEKEITEKIDMALYNEVVALTANMPTYYVSMK